MAYAIMRFQKYKLKDLGKIERHNNDRKHLKGRAHPELEKYNITKKLYENETLTQSIRKVINDIKENKGKTTRKDAAVVAEFVLTFSPEAKNDIMSRGSEWIKENMKWLKNEFESKGAKVLRFDLHQDEANIHIHSFVQMTDERGLFSAKRYFGKISQLENLQTSYATAMAKFGLERGISKSETKSKHITLNEYYKQTESKIKDDIEKLKADGQRIEEKRQQLAEFEKIIDDKLMSRKEIDNIFNDER